MQSFQKLKDENEDDFSKLLGNHKKVKDKIAEYKSKPFSVVSKSYNFRTKSLTGNDILSYDLSKFIEKNVVFYKESEETFQEFKYIKFLQILTKCLHEELGEDLGNEYYSAVIQSAIYATVHNKYDFHIDVANILFKQPHLFFISRDNKFIHAYDDKTGSNILHILCLSERNGMSVSQRLAILNEVLKLKIWDQHPLALATLLKHQSPLSGTPLHLASVGNDEGIINAILDSATNLFKDDKASLKSFISSSNLYGFTPLHIAFEKNNVTIFKKLIEIARPLYQNDAKGWYEFLNPTANGRQPLQEVNKFLNHEVSRILLKEIESIPRYETESKKKAQDELKKSKLTTRLLLDTLPKLKSLEKNKKRKQSEPEEKTTKKQQKSKPTSIPVKDDDDFVLKSPKKSPQKPSTKLTQTPTPKFSLRCTTTVTRCDELEEGEIPENTSECSNLTKTKISSNKRLF